MLKKLGLALLALSFASPGGAAVLPVPDGVRAFADVQVDGVEAGAHTIVVSALDVLVLAEDAKTLHIPVSAAALRSYAYNQRIIYISLAALAPGVSYHFDDASITLSVHVAPLSLGTTTTAVAQDAPPAGLDVSRAKSIFGNYLISRSTTESDGFLEAGESSGNHLLYSNVSAQSEGTLERGSTYYVFDDVAHRRRETLGDATFFGDSLVGDTAYFGLGIRRAFELDPFLYRSASPSIQGVISSPATADIYVNGVVTRSVPLLPGGFNLTQLPATSGQNDVAVVVRDADGNVQRFDRSYFATPSLLRPGLTDYQYGLGSLRRSDTSSAYGPGGFYGAYRVGVNSSATIGGRLVSTRQQSVGEFSGDFKIPYGAVHVAAARSVDRGVGGNAFAADATVQSATASFTADVALHSATFADLTSVPSVLAPATFDGRLSFSHNLRRNVALTLQAERQTFTALPAQTRVDAIVSSSLGRVTNAVMTFSRERAGTGASESYLNLSLSRAVGPRGTIEATTGGGTASFGYQSSPASSLTGFGYDVQVAQTNGRRDFSLDTIDHLPIADLQTTFDDVAGSLDGNVTLSGGFASIAGKTMASRSIGDAFVLVDSGQPGVAITLDGRAAGMTDRNGYLIVSEISANGVNRLAVDDGTLAIDDEAVSAERYVSPGARGGSVARLRVAKIAYFIGTIRLSGQAGTHAGGGTVDLMGPIVAKSPLDDDGRYYFENLTPGRYTAHVRTNGTDCGFTLVVPKATEIGTDLGIDTCSPVS